LRAVVPPQPITKHRNITLVPVIIPVIFIVKRVEIKKLEHKISLDRLPPPPPPRTTKEICGIIFNSNRLLRLHHYRVYAHDCCIRSRKVRKHRVLHHSEVLKALRHEALLICARTRETCSMVVALAQRGVIIGVVGLAAATYAAAILSRSSLHLTMLSARGAHFCFECRCVADRTDANKPRA
jgi:hypothetical protein